MHGIVAKVKCLAVRAAGDRTPGDRGTCTVRETRTSNICQKQFIREQKEIGAIYWLARQTRQSHPVATRYNKVCRVPRMSQRDCDYERSLRLQGSLLERGDAWVGCDNRPDKRKQSRTNADHAKIQTQAQHRPYNIHNCTCSRRLLPHRLIYSVAVHIVPGASLHITRIAAAQGHEYRWMQLPSERQQSRIAQNTVLGASNSIEPGVETGD
ncbi:hypothetical protein V1506DRAFT_546635 [Lipomyces tetrasporus]